MTNTTLPPHLERVGRQLTAAAHDLFPAPRRSRPRIFGLAAGSTTGLAAIATAAVLAAGATTATPPAFAVTRLDHGSVSVKVNRETSIAAVNRRLAAMGIEKINSRTTTDEEDLSSIPSCSSMPQGWKGEWVQMAGSSSEPGSTVSETVAPGTWVLIICDAGDPNAGPDGTGSTGAR